MSEFRKVHYYIIHIPLELLVESVEAVKKLPKLPNELIFSTTDETNKNPKKVVAIEDDWCQIYAKDEQVARGIELPIVLTNKWCKLSQTYHIKMEVYFTPFKEDEKVMLHELL